MSRLREVKLVGSGVHLPGAPVPYDDIDRVLGPFEGMSPEFEKKYQRTRRLMKSLLGMENYHYALDPDTHELTETCASMGARAARPALEMAGIDPAEVDLLIYAGSSLDRFICPPTSALLQEALRIPRCAEYSIHSNCTATYKALELGADLIAAGRYHTALIVSSNLVSNALKAAYFNPAHLDHNTAMLRLFLCDGAGALVLRAADRAPGPGLCVVDTFLESVGADQPSHMYSRAGSSTRGPRQDYEDGLHHIVQDFAAVSALGPRYFAAGFERMVAQIKGKKGEEHFRTRAPDVSHFLVNVPSRHLIDLVADELTARFKVHLGGVMPFDLYYSTVEKMGYTGPAAIALTLDRLLRSGDLKAGQIVVSFVTESSKWINAGFMLEQVDDPERTPVRA